MYDHYAQFYDATGQIRYSLLFYQYLHDLLALHPLPTAPDDERHALDLGCGTGTLVLLLADAGWRAAGVDLSAAMVAQARRKADALGLDVAVAQGDMRALALPPGRYDLVTCVYDSLNYLLDEADLAACFAAVARALRSGGLFVADMNSRHVLEQVWVGAEALEQPGYVQIQQINFDARRGLSTLHLTGMVGDDAHGYARFDERHVQRAYEPASVTELLQAAGLVVEGFYDAFTTAPPAPEAQRFVWVSRRV